MSAVVDFVGVVSAVVVDIVDFVSAVVDIVAAVVDSVDVVSAAAVVVDIVAAVDNLLYFAFVACGIDCIVEKSYAGSNSEIY